MKNLTLLNQFKRVLLVTILSLFSFGAFAQVQETFSPRFNQTVKGDMTMIANNVISRTATGNYTGSSGNHSFTDNVYVDIDNDNTTFNSSSANFTNPEPNQECLGILKAYIYWAAADKEQNNGNDNQPNWNYNNVKLMLPGQNTYTTITADDVIYRGRNSHFSNDPYICFKDITASVNGLANPYGKYQVANVEAKTGSLESHGGGNTGTSGGWQIVFIYESPNMPSKNISIFDGYAHVTSSVNNFNIDFNGFQTVPSGTVDVDVMIGALEGDRDLSGDRLQIRNASNNYVNITAPQRSSDNFFNSRITVGNNNYTDRNPASTNTLGFDAAVFNLDNTGNSIITNNQTSARLRLSSNQETYGFYLLGLSVDVWAPDLSPIHIVLDSGSNPANPGDTVGFNFDIFNSGNDDATNLTVSTTLPPQVEFIAPNNLPTGVSYTYNAVTGNLTFNIANNLVNVGDPELNIDFDLAIKDECYFLEDNCDLSFELQFVATYNGVENPNLQNTLSSAGLTACNTGNQLPLIINVNPPAPIVWTTAEGELDRAIDCSDTAALAAAQALEPETDKCDFTYTKTSGTFVVDGSCPNTGTYTNTWVFTDACGNTISEYIQVITIGSPDGPSFVETLPSDLAVECDEVPEAVTLTATVNCGTATVTFNETSTPGSCAGNYTLTRTWTATDECDNETVHTQTITVQGTTAPVAPAAPADITYECLTDVPAAGDLTATDNCAGNITVTGVDSVNNADACNVIITRTWTFTDACDNTSSVSQTITVADTTAPTFVEALPADITVECDVVPTAETLTASDNCGTATVTFNETSNPGTCAGNYTLTRTWTATDKCDNETVHTQTITVQGTTAPTFVEALPTDITVECDAVPTAETLTAENNCGTATVAFNETSTPGSCAGNYTLTRTWTATDECDNETVHTQTITVTDNTAPVAPTAPADITYECLTDVPAAGDLTATDNCAGNITVTGVDSVNNADACNVIIMRTWTFTDACNNTSSVSQTITVTDTTAPVAPAAPADITYECLTDVPAAGDLTAADNCAGNITVTGVDSVNNADACNVIITRTWTFTDACDNTSSVSQTITVADTTAPTFVEALPADITVECDVVPTAETLTASDNCGTATVTFNETSNPGTCAGNYTLTRTWTATDKCDNETVHTQTITVQGTTAPTFVEALPTDITVECDAVPTAETLTAENNCGTATVAFNETSTPGSCAGNYTLTRTWTATDECDNETVHTQTITVTDNTAPVAPTAPADITYECLTDVPAAGDLTATDNCAGNITVTGVDSVNNADACNVIIMRTWTFTDACNNTSSVSQTITVTDTTAPVAPAAPADITYECLTDVPAAGDLTAADNCAGNITVTGVDSVNNADACNVIITRTWTFTDACDNTSSVSQTITVTDTTAPTFVEALPADITVECDVVPTAETLTASDNCGTATVTFNETSNPGTCAGNYTLTRTWTATDKCDNETVHTQTITVQGTTAPTFVEALPTDITVECDAVPTAETLTAENNCGTATVAFNETSTPGSCAGNYTLTRTWTATDECDNETVHTQTITVTDNTAPVAPTAPADITYECLTDVPAAGDLTATDNCAGNITVTGVDSVNNADACNVIIMRTWTFTDACNNTSSVSQTITVTDTTAPVAPAAPADITYECLTDVPAAGDLTAADNCAGNITVTGVDSVNNADACNVIITRTWTFTDACDNTSSVSQTITVTDTTAPVAPAAPADITYECLTDVPAAGDLTATDNCAGNITVTGVDSVNNADACNVIITRTWTFTDACNNTSSVSQTITVTDTTAPVAPAAPADITYECLTDVPAAGDLTATDNCAGNITVTGVDSVNNADACNVIITRTWTFTDTCDNTSSVSQTITVTDTTAPIINTPATNLAIECSDPNSSNAIQDWLNINGGASASDNCSTNLIWTNNYSGAASDCSLPVEVTFTVTDECGNSISTSATYTIQDNNPPTITPASSLTVQCDGNGNINDLQNWLNTNAGATATDDCSTVTWSNDFTALSDGCGQTGSATVIFTATDGCGNEASTTATFTIIDINSPPITNAAEDVIVVCDGNGNLAELQAWLDNNGGTEAIDFCSDLTWSNNFNGMTNTCGATGTVTVLFTVTDACGLSSSSAATFTIIDNVAPEFNETLPADITVECDSIPAAETLSASDTCSDANVTFNETRVDGSCPSSYILTRTWIATDECGLTTEHVQTITVQDTIAPTFVETLPIDITVECDAVPTAETLTATDTCGTATVSFNETITPGSCINTYLITRTWSAIDECKNTTTHIQSITVQDTTAPVLDIEAQDIVVECDGSGNNTAIQEWLENNGGAMAADNCSTELTWTNNYDGTNSDCSTPVEVIFTVTDDCGNSTSTSATYSIQDTIAPTITDASDVSVECDGNGNVTELQNWLTSNGGASGTDDCSTITWSNNFSTLSDECGFTGSATVTFTVTDACGNTSETTAVFSIIDTTAPIIDTLPSEVTIDCPAQPEFAQATATDTCSTDVTLTFEDVTIQGQCASTFSVTRTWTATDACGNTSSASQTINVQDTTDPTIDIVANDVTVECDGQGNTQALNDWLANNGGASASDSCSTNLTWTNNFTALSDECGNTGSATVTFTATDECGNSASATATFTIEDTTDPTIDIVANDVTVECDGQGNTQALNDWLANNGGASASDSCSTNLTWTNNFTALSDECGNTGSATVTFTATDECGNSATATATFTIEDTTDPTIDIVANDVTVECDGQGNTQALNDWLANNGGASASDSCSTNLTWTNNFTALSDECGNTGSATVTFTATDECGNSASATATFTIEDTTDPTIDIVANDVTVECDGQGNTQALNDWLANNGGASASDSCSTNLTWTNNFTALSDECGNTGSATVTFTATDECGNSASATATFTIEDTTDPTIDIVANDVTVECDGQGNTQALNDWLANNGGASASDSCSTNLTWTNNFTALSDECGNTGSATVTFTATDECGNSATATATFTIEDTTDPTIDIVANDVTVECDGQGNTQALNDWLANNGGASASDSCSTNLTWTNNFTALSDECGNTGSATVTFTATDECGNTATATATFTIEDTTDPTIDIVANDVTVECDGQGNTQALNDWLANNGGASASDSCSTNLTWTNNFTALSDECGNTGSATVTFTATDECGNSASATATFTIEDTTAPTILGDFETVINVNCDAIPEIPNLTFEDACSQSMTVSGPVEDIQGDTNSNYTIIREWIVSDECNNEETYTQTINVTVNSTTQLVDTELCIDDSSIDLFDLLSASVNTDGTWTVISGNATLNGSIFDPSSVTLGDYVFGYSETVVGQCPIEYEITINVNDDCVVLPCGQDDVIISKTVTANNDNINEFFTVAGIETCGFTVELQIFNRWGAMIYESKDYQNNWNGFSSKASIGGSNTVPTGTYYYVINLKNSGLKPFAGPIYVATK